MSTANQEQDRNPGISAGQAASDVARGAAAVGTAAAKAASGNVAGAVKDVVLNLKEIIVAILVCGFACLILFISVFYTMPMTLIRSLVSGKTPTITVEDVSNAYQEVEDSAREAFEGVLQDAASAANTAASNIADSYRRSALEGGKYYSASASTDVYMASLSPVKNASDITDYVYLLVAIYDENYKQKTNEINEIVSQRIADYDGDLTPRQISKWSDEAFEEVMSGNDIDSFKSFINRKASSMLKIYFPTEYSAHGVHVTVDDSDNFEMGPAMRVNTVERTLPVSKKEYDETVARRVQWDVDPTQWDADPDEMVEVSVVEYEVEYVWRAEFDGINYLLKELGLATDGPYGIEITDEGREVYSRAYEKAENYIRVAHGDSAASIDPQAATEVIANLPEGLSVARTEVVKKALSIVGQVHYFWGGKSLMLGKDPKWGIPTVVTATGSKTTGTVRPYGMDCSGYVDWVFYNATGGEYYLSNGGGARAQHKACVHLYSMSDAQPGDLVFYDAEEHVGIVVGRDSDGNLQIAHCNASDNNVSITGLRGFLFAARPLCYGEDG